jgi:hypothetical protein
MQKCFVLAVAQAVLALVAVAVLVELIIILQHFCQQELLP